jgi:hypothetical protein
MKKSLIKQEHIYQQKVLIFIKQEQINLGIFEKRIECKTFYIVFFISSLIIRQRSNRPNSTYSTNNHQILLNTMTINGSAERNDENCSLLSRQRSHQSSIGIQHGHTQLQQQQQQLNPGLKQVNGKIHIESLSSSSLSSHNTQANNNGTPLDTNAHIGIT